MAHPSEAASLPSEIEPNSHLVVGQVDGPTATNATPAYEQITVCAAEMGTPGGYDMTKYDYIETGGVGCMVCWRWMHFNNHEGHKAGKKHMKKHQDLMKERPASNHISSIEWKPDLWEIIFPRESGRETMMSDDPDVKLEQYRATAGSDTQPMSAFSPDGGSEDRARWAASQARGRV